MPHSPLRLTPPATPRTVVTPPATPRTVVTWRSPLRAVLALPFVLWVAACDGPAATPGADTTSGSVAAAPAVALGAPDSLPSPAGTGAGEPNLATGADGRVYLSWLEPVGGSGGGHALRFAVLDGDRWSEARTIAQGTNFFVNWADFPSLLPLENGALAAHWLQRSGAGRLAYDVRLARSSDGGATWSESVVPHRDGTANEHGFVSLWPAGGDSVAAVWLDGRKYGAGGGHGHGAGEMTLMTAAVAADGALGAEQLLDGRTCDCCQTTMALTARGPVVLYRDRSPTEIRDISVVRHVDGRWTEPATVHADGWEIGACPVNGPAAAADGERVVAAWFTGARDTARVHVSFSTDAGATWSPVVRVDDGQPVGRVGAVLLDDGSALVSWLERTGGESAAVRVRRVNAGGAQGEAVTVTESSAARSTGFPRMARSGDAVYLAWTAPGTPTHVRVARLPLTGEAP